VFDQRVGFEGLFQLLWRRKQEYIGLKVGSASYRSQCFAYARISHYIVRPLVMLELAECAIHFNWIMNIPDEVEDLQLNTKR